jgi:broad specificity phosphatase PhoE
MRLYLLRHGESVKNLDQRFGRAADDAPLTEAGRAEIVLAAHRLQLYGRHAVACGLSTRALQSGAVVAGVHACELIGHRNLEPIDPGDVAGLPEDSARHRFPDLMRLKELYRAGAVSGYEICYPGGEDVLAFQQRVVARVALMEQRFDELVLLGHQSTITALLSAARANESGRNWYYYFELDLGRVSVIDLSGDGTWKVRLINGDFAAIRAI